MHDPLDTLLAKIADRSAVVGVIGLGYVGLPLAGAFERAGMRVIGFDTDAAKPQALRAGRSYLAHLGEEFFRRMASSPRFEATGDHARLGEADAILVCVPTPLDEHHEPDLSYVTRAARAIAGTLRRGQLVALESTTYPGTTRGPFQEALSGAGLATGQDYFLAFSPEREDPGRRGVSISDVPKVVGGVDEPSRRAAAALYRVAFTRVVEVSSAEVAECAKLLENIFRAVNIAMVNEMKVVLDAMGIDVWEVIDAASTKPYGFMPFHPGPGLGGHCIPIDPFYFSWKAREAGQPTQFIELAGIINTRMPEYVVQKATRALNDRGKAVRGSRVLVLGLAYKADIDDVRESPALVIIEKLLELGAGVDYHDPHVPRTHRMRRHDLRMSSTPLSPEMLRSYDCVLITTAHSGVDYAMIAREAGLVVDTRNAMRRFAPTMRERLVRA